MKGRRSRLAMPLALAALLLGGGTFVAAGSPAAAQCLSQNECDALKAQLKDFWTRAKHHKRAVRILEERIRALPRNGPQRRTFMEQLRTLRQEGRAQREAARPVRESFRQGCKDC